MAMPILQKISLLWRRFSPLEEQLIAAVRKVLSPPAQTIFDAQVAAITLVQRHPNEICFYRRRAGKIDWSGVPSFPRTDEFQLATMRFTAQGRSYQAKLTCLKGHMFDFSIIPGPQAVTFETWDAPAVVRLLADPLAIPSGNAPNPLPASWQELLARPRPADTDEWEFHDAQTAYRTVFNDGEFLVLAERAGDQFILHRLDPPASTLYYLNSHDGIPELVKGDVLEYFSKS